MYDDKTQVVVVGSALTGYPAACFWRRTVCHASSSNATPICSYILSAARGINPHTVELFRQIGLEPAIQARAM